MPKSKIRPSKAYSLELTRFNPNGAATLKGSDGTRIFCQELSMAFAYADDLLKSVKRHTIDPAAVAAFVAPDVLPRMREVETGCAATYFVGRSEFGAFLADRAQFLADTPSGNDKVRWTVEAVMPPKGGWADSSRQDMSIHGMLLEVHRTPSNDSAAAPMFEVTLYEPNYSVTYQASARQPEELIGLSLDDFMHPQVVPKILGGPGSQKTAVVACRELPSCVPGSDVRDPLPAAEVREFQTSFCTPAQTGDPSFGILAYRCGAGAQLREHVAGGKTPDERRKRWQALDARGDTGLYAAMCNGQSEAVRESLDLLASLDVTPQERTDLARGPNHNGLTGLGAAMLQGDAPVVEAYMGGLSKFQSPLSSDVSELAVARDSDGITALYNALEKGHAAAVRAYLSGLKALKLGQQPLEAAVRAANSGGWPALCDALAAQHGVEQAVEAYVEGVASLDLPRPTRASLLRSECGPGVGAASVAIAQGQSSNLASYLRAVEKYCPDVYPAVVASSPMGELAIQKRNPAALRALAEVGGRTLCDLFAMHDGRPSALESARATVKAYPGDLAAAECCQALEAALPRYLEHKQCRMTSRDQAKGILTRLTPAMKVDAKRTFPSEREELAEICHGLPVQGCCVGECDLEKDIATAWYVLGSLHAREGAFDKAIEATETAWQLYDTLGLPKDVHRVSERLADLRKAADAEARATAAPSLAQWQEVLANMPQPGTAASARPVAGPPALSM